MVVLSNVVSVLLIAAVVAACWWLAHDTDQFDEADLPPQDVCSRCLLDGIDQPPPGTPPTCRHRYHPGPAGPPTERPRTQNTIAADNTNTPTRPVLDIELNLPAPDELTDGSHTRFRPIR
ncbi:hypothetical protein [Nocardia transvalensis]|uniref:hypothetical protein n=1 Tax=Nocardia transvalensis TaxID=37333 RepID=UPI001895E1AA|nr:hypothetical protein [Nocardia transvalensis]MBF6331942.1 hypothetical protein [Nocardia transvalensis]